MIDNYLTFFFFIQLEIECFSRGNISPIFKKPQFVFQLKPLKLLFLLELTMFFGCLEMGIQDVKKNSNIWLMLDFAK